MSVLATRCPAPPRMSARQAAMRCGVSAYGLLKLVAAGRLKPTVEPGSVPFYHPADVERLAAELGVPAPHMTK